MTTAAAKGNITKYYVAHIFSGASFVAPITILYYASFGLSYFNIASLESIFLITALVFEIPTGALADTIGRKFSAGLGMLLVAIGMVFVGFGNSFVYFAIAQIIFGVGAALRSGADTSLMYDSLQDAGLTDRYAKTEGTSYAFFSVFGAIAAPIGAYLFVANRRLPFFVDALLLFFAALSYLFMIEFKKAKPKKIKEHYWSTIFSGIKQPFINPSIGWYFIFTIYISIIGGFFISVVSQPLIISHGINVIYIGYIFSAILIIQSLSSIYADNIASRISEQLSLIVIVLATGISLLMMSQHNIGIFFLFLLIFYGSNGFQYPLLKKYVHQHLPSDTRATILSTQNFFDSLAGALILPLLGFITDQISITYSSLLLGVIALSVGLTLLIFKPNILLQYK